MRQTLVGVFDRHADAQQAAVLLKQRGIPPDSVFLTEAEEVSGSASEPRADASRQEGGVLSSVKHFFSDLFGDDSSDDVNAYSEAVRRGGTLVKVEVEDEAKSDVAREALQSAGAVDIDERMSTWQQGSATAPSAGAGALQKGQSAKTDAMRDEEVIPVMREEIQVGKQTVRSGGVRVYARTVTEPVSQGVDLREERAVVQRRAVNRPVSADDANALKERTVEVTESVERPVVQKTARVVEEVVVGKEVREVHVDVKDSVRHTEVEVQSQKADGSSDANLTAYRSDFDQQYAKSGGRFEDYEPAYRYGSTTRADARHSGRSWMDAEGDLKTDWAKSNPGTPWERVKGAVRHGWDRTKT